MEEQPLRPAALQDRLWTRDFIMIIAVNFSLLLDYYMLIVAMTDYALVEYQASPAMAAFCASIYIVGTLITRFISAPIMRALGRKRTVIITTALEIVFTAVYLVKPPLLALMAVRFLHGLAYGVCTTTTATIGTSLVPHARKGEGVGYFMLSVTLGAAVGPFLGMFVSGNFGYEAMFAVATGISLLPLIGTLPIKVPEIGDEPAASSKPAAKASGASFLSSVVEKSAVPIALVCGLLFFGYSGILTFLTPYAQQINLSDSASFFFVMYALSVFATRPFTGRALDRRGPACVMIPSFAAYVAGMVVLSAASNDVMMLLAAALIGFGVGTSQASGLAMAVRGVPDDRLSLANSTFYIFIDTGVGIGPLILGAVLPFIGYNAMYLLLSALGLISLAMFLVIHRQSKAQKR